MLLINALLLRNECSSTYAQNIRNRNESNCKTPGLDSYDLNEMQALITNLLHMNKA